jgi:hypothetical protein
MRICLIDLPMRSTRCASVISTVERGADLTPFARSGVLSV